MKFYRLRWPHPIYRYAVVATLLVATAAASDQPLLYDIPPLPGLGQVESGSAPVFPAGTADDARPTGTALPRDNARPTTEPAFSEERATEDRVADAHAADAHAADERVATLVTRTLQRLALGDAFDAKLRQLIRVGGREVVGIGHYEQSGSGSGRYCLEMTVHDGDLRHTSQQISDGKLAWVRTQLGQTITLRRVDLGRIDELHRELTRRTTAANSPFHLTHASSLSSDEVPPWLRVGGLVELVDQIASDYDLRITQGMVEQEPVWILRGTMNQAAQQRINPSGDDRHWSPLVPFEVRLALLAGNHENGFGAGLPCRIEFWSRPHDHAAEQDSQSGAAPAASAHSRAIAGLHQPELPRGDLISLLEIYAHRRIEPSPEKRFRFEREERDVTFSEDTLYYLQRVTAPYTGRLPVAAPAEP